MTTTDYTNGNHKSTEPIGRTNITPVRKNAEKLYFWEFLDDYNNELQRVLRTPESELVKKYVRNSKPFRELLIVNNIEDTDDDLILRILDQLMTLLSANRFTLYDDQHQELLDDLMNHDNENQSFSFMLYYHLVHIINKHGNESILTIKRCNYRQLHKDQFKFDLV